MRTASVWASVGFTSLSWILFSGIYHTPLILPGAACLLAAIGGAMWGFHRNGPPPAVPRWVVLTLVGGCGAVFLFVDWGTRIALLLLCSGLLAGLVRGKFIGRLSLAASFVGVVSTLQASVMGLYRAFLIDRHFAFPLSFFDYWLSRLLGVRTTVLGGQVFFPSGTGYTGLTPNWDQFGLAWGLVSMCGVAVLLLLGESDRKRWPRWAGAGLVLAAYLVVRRLLLVFVVLEGGRLAVFWNPLITVLSILPLFLLLAKFFPVSPDLLSLRLGRWLSPGRERFRRRALLLAAVGTVAAASSLYLAVPGAWNGTTVLFDEAHGDWESTLIPMDTETYGMQSTYNMASLYEWLSYYYDVGQLEAGITEDALAECAVLVLKTPSKAYSDSEIEVIVRFVNRGGGLFVIGDHTNVFGTTTTLNPLLARFGLALNYDATYELPSGYFTRYDTPRMTFDPVMQHTDHFQFLTSCSIDVPLSGWRMIVGAPILASQADYSTEDFFAESAFTLSSMFGAFTQVAAVPHGRGRVLLFTDSTCFSNFSVHMDGYPQFLLGVFGFLGRRNPAVPVREIFAAVTLACVLGLGLLAMKNRRLPGVLYLVLGVVIGWAAFSGTVRWVHHAAYPLPEPRAEIPYVYFDMQHSDVSIMPQPPRRFSEDRKQHFETFFVWTQRIHQVPRLLHAPLEVPLVPGRPYVMLDPTSSLSEEFLAFIEAYVKEDGGRLVLMDRPDSHLRGLTAILDRFDLNIGLGERSRIALSGAGIKRIPAESSDPILISYAERGEGVVALVSDSTFFSDTYLGGAFTIPSASQKRMYELEYVLLQIGAPTAE